MVQKTSCLVQWINFLCSKSCTWLLLWNHLLALQHPHCTRHENVWLWLALIIWVIKQIFVDKKCSVSSSAWDVINSVLRASVTHVPLLLTWVKAICPVGAFLIYKTPSRGSDWLPKCTAVSCEVNFVEDSNSLISLRLGCIAGSF